MKTTIAYITPLFAAVAIAAIGLAPVAGAAASMPVSPTTVVAPAASITPPQAAFGTGEDPLVPNTPGADPYVPYVLGFTYPNCWDCGPNPAGGQDLPF